MFRYLLNISYLGTPFRGAQTQKNRKFENSYDPLTVQGQVEIGITKLLRPLNNIQTTLSSRTDAGVHAFHSTLHVDLTRKNALQYDPVSITLGLNKYFRKQEVPIKILKTYLVPKTFSCRHAISRTYLYRLAIVNTANDTNGHPLLAHVPVEEIDRCYVFCADSFDVDKMREASKLFLGIHDFRSFMGKSETDPLKVTRKCITRLDTLESKMTCYSQYSWPFCVNNAPDYKFYDIYIKADGFLYRQCHLNLAMFENLLGRNN